MTKLRLVVSNPDPVAKSAESSPSPRSQEGFSAPIINKGDNHYEMMAQDPSNSLYCTIHLEVEESPYEFEPPIISCHFPSISSEQLDEDLCGEETLLGIILIQFQMKILEQLFLFCTTVYASKLFIYTDDGQAAELGIYRDFLVCEGHNRMQSGEKAEMVIQASRQIFDKWIDFKKNATIKFWQTLWREQRNSPIIKQYLGHHSLIAAPVMKT